MKKTRSAAHAGELIAIPLTPRRPLMFGTRGTFGKGKPDRTVVFLAGDDALAYATRPPSQGVRETR